ATSPPQYWHRIELSEDAQFNINFWSDKDRTDKPMFHAKK
ncbi:MAG: cytoplasmic protein, partial [Psychromonas sp.]